uniref:Uncharacterized protein n=1 Tax=Arundo donax TaxID=35708 RepID=A0A0A8YC83_ARUDO
MLLYIHKYLQALHTSFAPALYLWGRRRCSGNVCFLVESILL